MEVVGSRISVGLARTGLTDHTEITQILRERPSDLVMKQVFFHALFESLDLRRAICVECSWTLCSVCAYLQDRCVSLWIGRGDTVDGLTGLALVVDGCLGGRWCWDNLVLWCYLGLYRHSLLGGRVPQRGVTPLARRHLQQ